MEELESMFECYKESGFMTNTYVAPFLGEALLTNKGEIDVVYLREVFGKSVAKTQVSRAFCSVFGVEHMPTKFSFLKEPSTISKEEFLSKVYVPAKYLNTRQFIEDVGLFKDKHLSREDLFAWILSTAKSKVFLGDVIYDKEAGSDHTLSN